jgi:Cft2 family RNA processing exonuclease
MPAAPRRQRCQPQQWIAAPAWGSPAPTIRSAPYNAHSCASLFSEPRAKSPEQVRIFGNDVPVRAAIHSDRGFSAHADQRGLLEWLRGFRRAPVRTPLVHGEYETAHAFAGVVRRELGWRVEAPAGAETAEI